MTRRRGPRSDVEVPVLLIKTAETMFGEFGSTGVSMRAVARRAGVAPAAVPYHFASKSDLIAAVLNGRADRIVKALVSRLEALVVDGGLPQPARALVGSLVEPLVDELNADPEGALNWIKLLVEVALAGDPVWKGLMASESSLVELFLAASRRALPNMPERQLRPRVALAMWGVLTSLAGADLAGYGAPLSASGLDPEFVEHLLSFSSYGLAGRPPSA